MGPWVPCGRHGRLPPEGAEQGPVGVVFESLCTRPGPWHNSYMPQANTLPGPAPPRGPSTADVSVDQIQASLQVVARSVTQVRVHERLLQSAGVRLDRAGAAALYKLHVHGDAIRITALAEMLGVDAPTVTRKIQQLERDGLVVRHADPDDGRASRIRLTAAGRRTLERILKARRAWLDHLLEGWDDEDLARFGTLLGRFASSLERDMEDARGS
jgi:DNA-binding MarR family transcriptional regulator